MDSKAQKISTMKEFWTDTRAVTPTEYAILAAFMSLVIAGVLAVTGKNVAGVFERLASSVSGLNDVSAKDVPKL